MTAAVTTIPNPDDQPKYLLLIPEHLRPALVNLSPREQIVAARMDKQLLAKLTPDEAREMVAEIAGNLETDEKTPYIPEVIEIIHAGQVFKTADGQILGGTLEGIVVHHHPTRGVWQEGEKLPLCASLDGITGHARPDAGPDFPWAINKEGSGPCTACPWDAWGSDPDSTDPNSNAKRCREKERLFFLTDDRSLPALIGIPPKSLTFWREFVSNLRNRKPLITTRMVRVKLTLEKAEKPGQVFSLVKPSTVAKLDDQTFLDASRMSRAIVEAAKKIGIEVGEHYDEPNSENGAADKSADYKPNEHF
jgi:hypothetical protein